MTDFERFQEFGRIRQIAKDADKRSVTYEKNRQLYIKLSSGQVIGADKFHGFRDSTIFGYIKMFLSFRGGA